MKKLTIAAAIMLAAVAQASSAQTQKPVSGADLLKPISKLPTAVDPI
jgi:hypothetical protein